MTDKKTAKIMRKLMDGKSAVARALDLVMAGVLVGILILFAIYFKFENKFVAYTISVCGALMAVCAVQIYKNIRLEKFIKIKFEEFYNDALLEEIALIKDKKIIISALKANDKDAFYYYISNHYSDMVTASQVINIYKKINSQYSAVHLYSSAKFNDAAIDAAKKTNIIIHNQGELISIAKKMNLVPKKSAVNEKLMALQSENNNKKSINSFSSKNIKKYLVCAVIIICFSFFSRFQAYYIVMAILCIIFALISFSLSRKSKQKSDYSNSLE